MTVVFYRLGDGTNYDEVARVEDGEIAEGESELPAMHAEELEDEQRLQQRFDGPYLVAAAKSDTPTEKSGPTHWLTEPRLGTVGWYDEDTGKFDYDGADGATERFLKMEDTSALRGTRTALVPLSARSDNLLKQADDAWIPYQGPQGGEGWQQVGSGEVRYQQNPPGDVAEGYEADHWRDQWPAFEDAEWDEDIPRVIDMKEGDHVLFVNRNGESEVGNVVGATFVQVEDAGHSKLGVKLEDGREIREDSIAAYADMTGAIEPPDLHGGAEWEDAPGMWTDYEAYGDDGADLVHFQDEDDDTHLGVVVDYSKSRSAVKVQTAEQYQVVQPDKIIHKAEVDYDYNVGYELLDSPFEDVPEVPFSLDAPDPDFAEWMGASTGDVMDTFSSVFGPHLVDNLEQHIESEGFDRDDPNEVVEAIVDYRGPDRGSQAWPEFKQELRGRAHGLSTQRVERIIDEAFALDVGDPAYNIRDRMTAEEKNNPEEWLSAAADYAMDEDKWVSLSKLQDAVYDWSGGSVPFSVNGVHDFDGEPEEIIPLSETGSNAGISAGAMFIADWSDGNRAYITRIRDEHDHGSFHSQHMESSVEAERAMTGYNVQRALNEENGSVHYPDHEYRYDTYFSVAGASDDAVLANDFMDESPTEDVELPDGKPDNDIAEQLGATVEDVQEAFGETVYPGWEDDPDRAPAVFENDPNLNPDNPADWVAAAKQVYDQPKEHVWNEFVTELAERTYETPVDREDFMDMAAAGVIAGNKDLHSNNVMVDSEGDLYPIDLDFSGYDMTESRHRDGGIGKLVSTAYELGLDASDEFAEEGDPDDFNKVNHPLGHELRAHIEEFAQRFDTDDVRSANPMYAARSMGDNVARNFEAAKRGELR